MCAHSSGWKFEYFFLENCSNFIILEQFPIFCINTAGFEKLQVLTNNAQCCCWDPAQDHTFQEGLLNKLC